MVTIKNIQKSKIPAKYKNYAADVISAIKTDLYGKDIHVKSIIDNFIVLVNFELSKSKKPDPKKQNSKEVLSFDISKIKVDPKRFQNRSKLNQAIVNNIVDNFKATDLDPLVIWLDPKDGKYYLLAGHHRHAALKKLGRKKVPVKIANEDYPSEKDAIRYARELSNANRTLETPVERAKIYRDKIAAGISKKELDNAAAKEGKNKNYILNLAHLNPNGRVIEALERFDSVTDKQNSNEIEKQADWIGAARKQFKDLTNAHESEMFTFLNDSSSSKRMTTKAAFLQYVNSIVGTLDFDSSKTLNLKRFKYKSEGESQYDDEVSKVKNSITTLQENIDYIKERFLNPQHKDYVKPSHPQYAEIKNIADNKVAEYNRDIKIFQTNLIKLYQNKSSYLNSGSNQYGMFGNVKIPKKEFFTFPQDFIEVIASTPTSHAPVKTVARAATGATSKTVEISKPIDKPSNKNTRAKGLRHKGTANPLFNIQGPTGEFFGRLERKPKGSIIITIDAKQGAGKTTAIWKFMNDVAGSGYNVLFASLEEHPESNLFQEKIDNYIDPQNENNISVVAEFKDYSEFSKEVKAAEFIFVDSWQKLEKMLPKLNMDEDIRHAFDGKVFPIIFQQTTTGRTKGGADKVFDADVVIKGETGSSFDKNYFIADKHRYTHGDIAKIAYNVAGHYVFDPTTTIDTQNNDSPQEEFITVMG